MKPHWEIVVKTPEERKVFECLSDPNWYYRTIEGIKMDTGLAEEQIERFSHAIATNSCIRQPFKIRLVETFTRLQVLSRRQQPQLQSSQRRRFFSQILRGQPVEKKT